MHDEVVIVYETHNRRAMADRALVLQSLGLPHEVVSTELGSALIVPAAIAERAKYELWQFEQENLPRPVPGPIFTPRYQNSIPGLIVYLLVVCGVAWLAGEAAFGKDWLAAGRIDGTCIRDGEWWRTVTALTLHADLKHLTGNIGFGMLFGFFAGRLLGSGVAWLAILLAAAAGNLLNTLLLESTHRAIGASTAVFAALGLVVGYVWRARLMKQDRWPYRYGPIVGGLALLAYTGTGDQTTDVGAHLTGFACGLAAGMLLTMLARYLSYRWLQRLCGAVAMSVLVAAWVLAL